MSQQHKPNIVVLGGGFGGLESAFYLRARLPDQANITLVSDRDYFLFKPNTIYIPFGLDPEKLKIRLNKPTRRRNIRLVHTRVRAVDAVKHVVETEQERIPYDFLIIATGAGMQPDDVPGLREHAEMIWTPQDMLHLRAALYGVVEAARGGKHRNVLFLVPPNNKCSGPLYELVMMLDTWLRRKGARTNVALAWSTYEQGYIQAFGPRLDTTVTGEFSRRQITGYKGYVVERVEANEVRYTNGERLPFDLLISFPPYIAALPFPGLPADTRGFVTTDLATRRVQDHPEVFAVGDAGDFPVKQAFLAFLQADAAAEQISAAVLGKTTERVFTPVSMCVMEEFDRATFAQVPLHLTGDATRPVEVAPGARDMYRVGTSPLWRLGKQALGIYLPWRFGAGNAFHDGVPWQGMELGLKVMSRVLAS